MAVPPGLPQIVDSKRTLAGDIGKIDHVQVEDLQTLWKVYTTNKNVIQTGRRLENLFWRIWGSDRLRKNISGRTVAAIFIFISEGEDAVKDPALKIPPSNQQRSIAIPKRSHSIIECPPTPPPSPARVPSGLSPTDFFEFQPSQTALSAELLQACPDTPPSPPSLPKVPPPSPASPMMQRPILARNHQSYPQTVLQQQQDAAFGTSQKIRAGKGRAPKKRATFAANTKPGATAEGKGSLMRECRSPLSKVRSVSPDSDEESSDSGSLSEDDVSSSDSTSKSPSEARDHVEMVHQSVPPQKPAKDNSNGNAVASTKSDSAVRRPGKGENGRNMQAWVVDPDFRLRFQERRKREEAGYRLKTAATTATVSTTALSVAEKKTGKFKGRGRNVYVVDDIAPLKFTEPIPELFTDESIRAEGVPIVTGPNRLMEKENEAASLVRTKSQLTLLIEDARRADGGPEEPRPSSMKSSSAIAHQNGGSSMQEAPDTTADDGFEDVDDDEDNGGEEDGNSNDNDADEGDGGASLEMKRKGQPRIKAKRRHRPRIKR